MDGEQHTVAEGSRERQPPADRLPSQYLQDLRENFSPQSTFVSLLERAYEAYVNSGVDASLRVLQPVLTDDQVRVALSTLGSLTHGPEGTLESLRANGVEPEIIEVVASCHPYVALLPALRSMADEGDIGRNPITSVIFSAHFTLKRQLLNLELKLMSDRTSLLEIVEPAESQVATVRLAMEAVAETLRRARELELPLKDEQTKALRSEIGKVRAAADKMLEVLDRDDPASTESVSAEDT